MGFAKAVKNAPVGRSKMAQVMKASPMGKVVQIKGTGKRGTGPASHLGKKATPASVKASTLSNKLAVVDMPKKSVNGRKAGKNFPTSKSTRADVTRFQQA